MADNQFIIEIRSKGFGPAKSNTKALKGSIAQLRQEVARHKKGLERVVVGSKQFEVRQQVLERSTKKLNLALGKLNQSTSRYIRGAESMRGTTSGLRRSIGALRNNILLVTFALSGATIGIKKFVDVAAGFQAVKTRLVGLTGSVGQAEKAFIKFNSVAATTPFSLDDVVNAGAQLKAFGADAEGLIKPITDLAAFMGTTAVEAANAFGRAFAGGAGAADILRERGILNIIKSSQGIADLSKTTLPNFRKALIASLQDPAVGIAGSTDRLSKTYIGAMSNMKDAVTRFQASIGDLLLPTLIKAANNAEKFFRAINIEHVEDFARSVTSLTIALALYNAKALVAAVRTAHFAKILRMTVVGLVTVGIERLLNYLGVFEDWNEKLKQNTANLQSNANNLKQGTQAIKAQQIVLNSLNIDMDKHNKLLEDTAFLQMKLRGATDEQVQIAKILTNTQQQLNDMLPDQVQALLELVETTDGVSLGYKVITDGNKELGEDFQNVIQGIVANSNAQIQLLVKEYDSGMDDMEKKSKEPARAIGQVGNAVLGLISNIKSGDASIGDFISAFGQIIALTGGGAGVGAGMQIFGQLMNVASAHTGGLVTPAGIQRFAAGGPIRGGDNVPILAQGGEFVMNRGAVSDIGLDRLTDMNRMGSSGSSITVNISGGVIQDDYVRNELIPALNKATGTGTKLNA